MSARVMNDYIVTAAEVREGDLVIGVSLNNDTFPRVTSQAAIGGVVRLALDVGERLDLEENRLVMVSRAEEVEPPKITEPCEWCTRAGRKCWLHGGVAKVGPVWAENS